MSEKLTDALNLVRIYEKLKGVRLVEPIDCYYLFVVVLVQDMVAEDKVQLHFSYRLIAILHDLPDPAYC